MSVIIMAQVWKGCRDLTPVQKLVLLKYADNANDEGVQAFPSQRMVAEHCGVHPDTVKAAIKALKQKGYLVEVARSVHHRGTEFRVIPDPRNQTPEDLGGENQTPEMTVVRPPISSHSDPRNDSTININDPSVDPSSAVTPLFPREKTQKEIEKEQDAERGRQAKKFIDGFAAYFEKERKQKFMHRGAQDVKIVKELLKTYSFDRLIQMSKLFLDTNDTFLEEAGYHLGVFKGKAMALDAKLIKMGITDAA